jgi:hypothetical protein
MSKTSDGRTGRGKGRSTASPASQRGTPRCTELLRTPRLFCRLFGFKLPDHLRSEPELSNVTREHIDRARKIVPIVSVQNRYSFADRDLDYVVDYCENQGIAFIPWFPLGAAGWPAIR